jgi:hypothetical protein
VVGMFTLIVRVYFMLPDLSSQMSLPLLRLSAQYLENSISICVANLLKGHKDDCW